MSIVERDPLEQIPTLPEEPETRRDVLLRAARLVQRYGHQSMIFGTPGQGFCPCGAVAWAMGIKVYRPDQDRIDLDRLAEIEPVLGCSWEELSSWNLDNTSKAKSVSVLRRLADGKSFEEAIA